MVQKLIEIALRNRMGIAGADGPPMINSENAMLRGTVLFNVRDRDLGSTVQEALRKLNLMATKLPKGYFLEWSGRPRYG